jgi:two-component system NarL family sensor kinase
MKTTTLLFLIITLGNFHSAVAQTDTTVHDSVTFNSQVTRPAETQVQQAIQQLETIRQSGTIPKTADEYASAIDRYSTSLHLAEKAGDSLSVSVSLSNLAGMYIIRKKFDLAEQCLLRCLAIRQSLKDDLAVATTFSDLGSMMMEKGDFKKSYDYFSTSNKIAEALDYFELLSNNYSELSTLAQKERDYGKAFEYFSKKTSLRDSLYLSEKNKEFLQLNSKYESARKEQQITAQQNRLRLQSYLFIGIGILALFGGLLIYSFYKRYKLQRETQLQAEIMKQQEMRVNAVMQAEENERQRIAQDLHDGIGQMMSAAKMNLSAFESEIRFSSDTQKNDLEKIINLVDESCREIRTVSHIMMPNALLKNNLAVAIGDFVNKVSNNTLQVHLYTEGLEARLDPGIETMIYRIIQECVHNAVKHAGATTLDISLIRDRDGISGTIEDNGKGFDPSTVEAEGIGLKNISTRIAYLKGSVDFDASPGRGTVVAIHIPLS